MTNSRRVIVGSTIGWATSSPSDNSRCTAEGGSTVQTGARDSKAATMVKRVDLHIRLNAQVAFLGSRVDQLAQAKRLRRQRQRQACQIGECDRAWRQHFVTGMRDRGEAF